MDARHHGSEPSSTSHPTHATPRPFTENTGLEGNPAPPHPERTQMPLPFPFPLAVPFGQAKSLPQPSPQSPSSPPSSAVLHLYPPFSSTRPAKASSCCFPPLPHGKLSGDAAFLRKRVLRGRHGPGPPPLFDPPAASVAAASSAATQQQQQQQQEQHQEQRRAVDAQADKGVRETSEEAACGGLNTTPAMPCHRPVRADLFLPFLASNLRPRPPPPPSTLPHSSAPSLRRPPAAPPPPASATPQQHGIAATHHVLQSSLSRQPWASSSRNSDFTEPSHPHVSTANPALSGHCGRSQAPSAGALPREREDDSALARALKSWKTRGSLAALAAAAGAGVGAGPGQQPTAEAVSAMADGVKGGLEHTHHGLLQQQQQLHKGKQKEVVEGLPASPLGAPWKHGLLRKRQREQCAAEGMLEKILNRELKEEERCQRRKGDGEEEAACDKGTNKVEEDLAQPLAGRPAAAPFPAAAESGQQALRRCGEEADNRPSKSERDGVRRWNGHGQDGAGDRAPLPAGLSRIFAECGDGEMSGSKASSGDVEDRWRQLLRNTRLLTQELAELRRWEESSRKQAVRWALWLLHSAWKVQPRALPRSLLLLLFTSLSAALPRITRWLASLPPATPPAAAAAPSQAQDEGALQHDVLFLLLALQRCKAIFPPTWWAVLHGPLADCCQGLALLLPPVERSRLAASLAGLAATAAEDTSKELPSGDVRDKGKRVKSLAAEQEGVAGPRAGPVWFDAKCGGFPDACHGADVEVGSSSFGGFGAGRQESAFKHNLASLLGKRNAAAAAAAGASAAAAPRPADNVVAAYFAEKSSQERVRFGSMDLNTMYKQAVEENLTASFGTQSKGEVRPRQQARALGRWFAPYCSTKAEGSVQTTVQKRRRSRHAVFGACSKSGFGASVSRSSNDESSVGTGDTFRRAEKAARLDFDVRAADAAFAFANMYTPMFTAQ